MSTNTGLTETELIAQMQCGDMAAFDAIYHTYFQAVYGNILRLTHDAAATDDIIQEVFIRLWEKKDSLDVARPLGNWLFVVSYNRSMNYLRDRQREKLAPEQLATSVTAAENEWQITEAQLQLIEEAIGQLPPQRKRVFTLCKIQGKTYAEAAETLNISRYTVKEHITKANDFIREYARMHPDKAFQVGVPLLAYLAATC
ncbi:RNA polymerase sigma-70 factor, ECF subfamily [Chitinophaga jiangningensis]|uniref:RNA polymerase sigma-70 factor, ECF subfamily n=1 Tax=Chitinophaga jiangningensis TaxID=1419482 RepID=A0A1M6VVZ4_9BACT|nr:sigma-70 family RNA polymerase sigma factor [Chitinophaga jiangningensis]SHK85611.1 RNA polymerase sigma-70 factor, ECF subfamily [Chitinophaga jiangningensis]